MGEYVTRTALIHGGENNYNVPEGTVVTLTDEEAQPLLDSGAIFVESKRDKVVREALEAEGLSTAPEDEPFEGQSLNDSEGAREDNTLPDE